MIFWRLNHRGGNYSLDPLNWVLQDFLGEIISQGFLGRKYILRILGRKYLSRSIKLGYWFEKISQPSMRFSTYP
jgi:hypothetical protein